MASPYQYQGIAIIRINGREYPSLQGAQIVTGGIKRAPVVGQKAYGWQAEYTHAQITCQFPNGNGLSIADLNAMDNVTITFEADVGKTWLLPNAWSEGSAQLTDKGQISTSFASVEAKEI